MYSIFYNIIPQAKLPRNVKGDFIYQSNCQLQPGDLVTIEFRKSETIGLVVGPLTESDVIPFTTPIKSIKQVINPTPHYFVELIQWASEYYSTSPAFIFDLMMPRLPKRQALTIKEDPSLAGLGRQFKRLRIPHRQLNFIKNFLTDQTTSLNTFRLNTASKLITYYKLAQQQLNRNKSTILLTPTINHLELLLRYLPGDWQDKINLLYSGIYTSKTKHWHRWQKINTASQPVIIIGTRSAIFAPVNNLGLIIIDQAEADDYKQYDQNPRYDARTVALKIGELTGGRVKMFSDGVYLESGL